MSSVTPSRRPPLRWSLRAKVFVLVLTICVGLVAALTTFYGRQHVNDGQEALASKALNYGNLASNELESAIAFDDHDAVREVFAALNVDEEVKAVGLYTADGKLIEKQGEAEFLAVPSREPIVQRSDARIRCAVAVIPAKGRRGVVVIEMSTKNLERRRAATKITGAVVMMIGALVALVVAWLAGRYMTQRLDALSRNAASVARGEFGGLEPVREGGDELGDLAKAFGVMTTKLMAQNEHRTAELATRNAEMRTLLDHVAQGFMTIDAMGRIRPERSAILERWFGELPVELTVSELLNRVDADTALWFDLAWEVVTDGSMPLEVALEQAPKAITGNGRTFALEVKPILVQADRLSTALLVVTDVTDTLERERTNATRAEVLTVLERALEDRGALMEFLEEGGALVDAVVHERGATIGDIKRAIHTLKGNCGLFGLGSVSRYCHELETRIVDLNEPPSPSDRRELRVRWAAATASLVRVFSKASKDTIDVPRGEIEDMVSAIDGGATRRELARKARLMRLEPMALRLQRIAEGAYGLAERLDKNIEVEVRTGTMRFDAAAWAPFWAAFTHVVRNAVDHGIEEVETRAAHGKRRAGKIRLDAAIEGDSFVLRVSDDGRGIDWSTVAERASALGAPCVTTRDLEAALFIDGLSSKREITDVSGRGIGLGAVLAACSALRGVIRIDSAEAEGTTCTFVFPVEALGDAYTRIYSRYPKSA